MKDVLELLKSARRVSTPLVAISTPDQRALARRMFVAMGNGDTPPPKIAWDVVNGAVGVNDTGKAVLGQEPTQNPVAMLFAAADFPEKSIVVMYNAHLFFGDPTVMQAVCNLRDRYCENMRTLVMLAPSFRLPPELADVVLLDEELPSDEQLGEVLGKTWEDAYDSKPDAVAPEWVDAVRGLSAFTAEQVFAMSLSKEGVDLDDLWERKRSEINKTRGLKFARQGPTFDTLGGLESFKDFMRGLGKKPGVVVFMDEIDKSIAGAQGDTSGVSQDFHGTLLSWMEDHFHDGLIAVGPPGSGKTAGGMAIGPTLDVPTVVLDINAMKGSLVGESERSIRDALKVVDSVAGEAGAFVFATCNSEKQLAPEFKRRFRSGTWFFDLPTNEERDVIWNIHLEKHALPGTIQKRSDRPDDVGWTGAEIRNCCDLAARRGRDLKEAARYVVPVSKSNQTGVEALRKAAHGRWLSASYPGPYVGPRDESGKRKRTVSVS